MNISKLSFAFISYIVVASGYVTQVLPCQTQKFMTTNIMAKHIIGVLLCFMFIMLEGGWSFDLEVQEKAATDWSNGNVVDSLIYGVVLYTGFLLSAKMQIVPNLILYTLLFGVYFINTQISYLKNRELISEENHKKNRKLIELMLYLAAAVFVYGIVDYFFYQKKSYGHDFSILKFILGNNKCASL